ncbi:CAP domain-containing protein [Demequina gelatinilytica]|uniref:CAP domain-containing protein n=1 Tax=Demequina gelatinilytica TaxID=1638980 RepID=UPI0007857662|nr:CAP domain-containing protein [Demequina gelatinilytica]
MRPVTPVPARRPLALAGLLALATAIAFAATAVVPAGPADAATDPLQLVIDKTNAHRTEQGLKPLAVRTRIATVSEDWSQHMKSTRTLAHNPSFATEIPGQTVRSGENVGMACGYGGAKANASTVMTAWLKSAGHEANISGNYSDLGVGIVYDSSRDCVWATQNFAKYDGTYKSSPSPWIQGTAAPGKILTAKTRAWKWSPRPTSFRYQWLRDGQKIDGATSATYKVTKADKGHKIRVRITAKKSGFMDQRRKSGTKLVS